MKNTFGNALAVTLFGESHGNSVGVVLDGLAPGIAVDEAEIRRRLSLRRPKADGLSTERIEPDEFTVESGVFRGRTTGTPLCIRIPNTDRISADYAPFSDCPRPSHADYTAAVKSGGFADLRGGGHASGRLTAALVAAGAIVLPALAAKGILIGTHLAKIGSVADRAFGEIGADLENLQKAGFPVLSPEKGEEMKAAILAAKADGDSIGGICETAVSGLPAGIGEPWFDSAEGMLSHALFSIPAVKGVEFGDGFAFAGMRGSAANDAFCLQNGTLIRPTNHGGGIEGGITNGMPLLFRCAFKPTPSIARPQKTVDLKTVTETEIAVGGRHDPCVAVRACPVIDSVTALVLYDLCSTAYGTNWFAAR